MKNAHVLAWLLTAVLSAPTALADDGHNHDAAPAAPSGAALPRFTATSELFELVGVVNGKQLTVYLDRFGDNEPVKGAKVELDVGGANVPLQEHEPGQFEGAMANGVKPGVTAVTATVTAANETDILVGELDVHEEAHAEPAHAHRLGEYAGWGAGTVVVLGALALAFRRRLVTRHARQGGAA